MSKIKFNEYVQNKDEFDVQQLSNLFSGPVVWSWGAHNFTNFFNKALTFKVQGFKHKGIVDITYNRVPDLFNVEIRNSHYNLVSETNEVYVDQLVEIIDRLVETDNDSSKEYKTEVENHYGF